MKSIKKIFGGLFEDELVRAAKDGAPEAQFLLGKELLSGVNRRKEVDTAIKWIKKSANAGTIKAQLMLGRMYRDGENVEKDVISAMSWYEMAYDNNDATAAYELACLYLEDIHSERVTFDGIDLSDAEQQKMDMKIEKVRTLLQFAINNHILNAEVVLGLLLMSNEVFEHDYVEGVRMLKIAANKGSVTAQYAIGDAYKEGKGVERNEIEAELWYKLAKNNAGN